MGGNVGYLIASVSIKNRLELRSWSCKKYSNCVNRTEGGLIKYSFFFFFFISDSQGIKRTNTRLNGSKAANMKEDEGI